MQQPRLMQEYQTGYFKKHGRWKSENAKDGYVKDKMECMLKVSKSLEFSSAMYTFFVDPSNCHKLANLLVAQHKVVDGTAIGSNFAMVRPTSCRSTWIESSG